MKTKHETRTELVIAMLKKHGILTTDQMIELLDLNYKKLYPVFCDLQKKDIIKSTKSGDIRTHLIHKLADNPQPIVKKPKEKKRRNRAQESVLRCVYWKAKTKKAIAAECKLKGHQIHSAILALASNGQIKSQKHTGNIKEYYAVKDAITPNTFFDAFIHSRFGPNHPQCGPPLWKLKSPILQ